MPPISDKVLGLVISLLAFAYLRRLMPFKTDRLTGDALASWQRLTILALSSDQYKCGGHA